MLLSLSWFPTTAAAAATAPAAGGGSSEAALLEVAAATLERNWGWKGGAPMRKAGDVAVMVGVDDEDDAEGEGLLFTPLLLRLVPVPLTITRAPLPGFSDDPALEPVPETP